MCQFLIHSADADGKCVDNPVIQEQSVRHSGNARRRGNKLVSSVVATGFPGKTVRCVFTGCHPSSAVDDLYPGAREPGRSQKAIPSALGMGGNEWGRPARAAAEGDSDGDGDGDDVGDGGDKVTLIMDMGRKYLFSICIPSSLQTRILRRICNMMVAPVKSGEMPFLSNLEVKFSGSIRRCGGLCTIYLML